MSQGESGKPRPGQRPGTCHRCGWNGYVSKVVRRQRKQLGTGRKYGRLCPTCFAELLGHKSPATTKAERSSLLKAVHDRDVA
jgi:hypothetical protein